MTNSLRVRLLAETYDQVYRCDTQAKLMEYALNIIKVVSTGRQRDEFIKLIATRDPILWYSMCSNTNINFEKSSPEMILEKFILTLKISKIKINKDYHDIIRPKLWGKPLKEEYRKFEQFAEDYIEQEYNDVKKFFFVYSIHHWS